MPSQQQQQRVRRIGSASSSCRARTAAGRALVAAVSTLAFVSGSQGKCVETGAAQCYTDNGGQRTLRGYSQLGGPTTGMTRVYCAQICHDHSFSLAGVEYGHQCFCGNAVASSAKRAPAIECAVPCTSNHTEKCGGSNFVDVFSFTCSGPPAPAPPPVRPPTPAPTPPRDDNLCPDFGRPYCNPSKPLEDRVSAFLGHMTKLDKMMTMAELSVQGRFSDGTPLVGKRGYRWWSEALHGVVAGCGEKCATQFPEANAAGCSFNASLWEAVGDAVSTEARAMYRVGGVNGLSFFAPQLNMASNPLWGRNMECPGEDPHVTSVYARAYVRGMQGSDPSGILKTVCTPKHFVGQVFEGDGSDPWGNGTTVNRQSNDTRYPLHDLEKYFLPAFRAAMVDAGAGSVMCAYQGINGVPACANGFLLERVVRGAWGWNGFVVSDCDAIKTMMVRGEPGANPSFGHAYSLTGKMAVQDGVYAGCDSNCGDPYRVSGMAAVADGSVTETMLNASVRRLLRPLLQLGLFDPPASQPFTHYNWTHVATPAHRQLALDAARQSLVLLQNPRGLLPLRPGGRVLVAGPLCNATQELLGNYHGTACQSGDDSDLPWEERCMPPLSASVAHFNGAGGSVSVLAGVGACDETADPAAVAAVVAAARAADAVVLAVGGACHEGEGTDRNYLELPHAQEQLFVALDDAGLSAKVAVVVVNGGPYAVDNVTRSDAAALQAGFPGQAGGRAIAEAIFGVVNPSGKLTTTIYPRTYAHGEPVGGAAPWMDPQVRPHDGFPGLGRRTEGRTHMWYRGPTLFPFGHGLSYTNFTLAWASGAPPAPASVSVAGGAKRLTGVAFSVTVRNTGAVAGKETVLAFWKPPASVDPLLVRELFAFDSAVLAPAESAELRFTLPPAVEISTVAENGDRFIAPGAYAVEFSRGHGATLTAGVNLVGDGPVQLRAFASRWVDGHEVTADACVEGTSDVIAHTESFLVDYKVWRFDGHAVVHNASGMCLTWDGDSAAVLRECTGGEAQRWDTSEGQMRLVSCPSGFCCLFATAASTTDLRRNVTVAANSCGDHGAAWTLDARTGLLRSGVGASSRAGGLCLAARSVGRYNAGS